MARDSRTITDAEFQAMLQAANDWRYLMVKAVEGQSREVRLAQAARTAMEFLDAWLMRRYDIDACLARTVANLSRERETVYSLGQDSLQWFGWIRPEPTFTQYPELRA